MIERWENPVAERIAAEITARTGMIIVPERRRLAEASIASAMRRAGISDAEQFVSFFDAENPALDDLMAELTIGETYFFREVAQFDLVRETIVPGLLARRGATYAVRAWSAACASGEEAYSLAIVLRETSAAPHYVVGTDISRERLSKARRGHYRRWSLRGVPDAVIRRYFTGGNDEVTLAPEIRRAATFRYLNLVADSLPALTSGIWGMDVIFCRNVLIYFDRDTIAHVGQRLIDTLGEDGWLILGAADPPLREFVNCEVVETPAGLAYRRPTTARVRAVVRAAVPFTHFDPPAPPAPGNLGPVVEEQPPAAAVIASPPEAVSVARLYEEGEYDLVALRVRAMAAPTTAESVAMVRSLANLGLLAEAGAACTAALDADRMSAELQYLHGILLLQASMPEEAAVAARRALYLDPSLVVAHLALGTALTKVRRFPEATRALANAESLLAAIPAATIVPASDGERAGRLLTLARVQRELVDRSAA